MLGLPSVVAVCVLLLLRPGALLTDTAPALGDFAGHAVPFRALVDGVLGAARVHGWSGAWFGGFPLFYFYFPLPGLIAAAVTPALGFNVALKVVGSLGLLGLPFAATFLARSAGAGRVEAGLAGAVGASFVLMTSYDDWGGNALSTLNGEFAYSISLCLSVLYLGCAIRMAAGRDRWWIAAALCLAATALSHLVTTIAVVVATVPLLSGRGRRPLLRAWIAAFLVSGFWSIPFLTYRGMMADLPWASPRSVVEVFPGELLYVLAPAALGVVAASRRGWHLGPLLTVTVLGLAVYLAPEVLFMRARLLPYWYLGLHLFAGLGVAVAGSAYVRSRRPASLALAMGAAGCLVLMNVLRDPARIVDWAELNNGGIEARDAWPGYRALVDALDDVPPGIVHWEDAYAWNRYGSPVAAAALPLRSPGHDALGGLWAESTRATAFYLTLRDRSSVDPETRVRLLDRQVAPFDLDAALPLMRAMGARYYLTASAEAAEAARARPDLTEVAAADFWALFDAGPVPRVEVATRPPEPVPAERFAAAAGAWWEAGAAGGWPVAVATLPGVADAGGLAATSGVDEAVGVTGATWLSERELRFSTTAVGRPHLVRVPWFPRWTAEGAEGPYRAGPEMMVVVPTDGTVTLAFGPGPAERLGGLATLAGLALLGIAGVRRKGPVPGPAATTGDAARAD